MMIALKDASNKHCPIMRTSCVGDKCMMWRWATVEQLAYALNERTKLDDGHGIDIIDFVDKWKDSTSPPEGYCGLAGLPDCVL